MNTCRDCGGQLEGRVDNTDAHSSKAECVRRLRAVLRQVRSDLKMNEGRVSIVVEAEIDDMLLSDGL